MNTYLLPVCDINTLDSSIEKVVAHNLEEAQDKFIGLFVEKYSIDYPGDFDELFDSLLDIDIVLGDIYDLEEFK